MILETKDLNKCYGCFACMNICPKKCIDLKQDQEGFFMPVVDEKECVQCGLCDKVCIIDKKTSTLVDRCEKEFECYYGFIDDDAARKRSASGGLSYTLAANIIHDGGIVYGVVGKWFEDVHHIRASTLEELNAICGSKNIQSRVGLSYQKAKEDLEQGKKVFFTGTPCQIAAFYSFLGKEKHYPNLLTADLICHGVPSQLVLKAYIAELEKEHKQKVVKFGRDQTFQYLPVQYIAWFEDGTYEILMPETCLYRKGFLSNLYQRKSCAGCEFSQIPRVADITMGDVMFSVDIPVEHLDPKNLGVSLVTANSKNGKKALMSIKNIFMLYPMETMRAINGNRWLSHGISENKLRTDFFKIFFNDGFLGAKDIIQKSYEDMIHGYVRDGKIYRLKLLFKPRILIQKFLQRLRKKEKHIEDHL